MNDLTDKQLAKLASNDTEHFRELYHRHVEGVYKFVRFRTNSTEDAHDIVSDVFLKALKGIGGYNDQYAFSTWLYTIARRTLVDFWRKQKVTFDIDGVYDLADETINLNASCDIKMRVEYVMEQLNETERNLVVMRYEQDLSFKEIAQITGKTEGSLRTAFSRLKKVIKDLPV